ncbi:MAG: hypothetical protein NTX88_02685 [Candidatus Atribacteria bacterium]|nr:hypothetical protein [Candidatus Atribacteria bacterium]
MKRMIWCTITTVSLILICTVVSWGYDVVIFGNGPLPGKPDNQAVISQIDLGQHSVTPDEWEKWLSQTSDVMVLPSPEEIKTQYDLLKKIEGSGKTLVASDLLDSNEKAVFTPYGLMSSNYHTVAVLNFVGDVITPLLDETLKAIQKENPEKILAIGTEKNISRLREKLSTFQDKTEFLEREKIEKGFSQIITITEKPVILFFFSSRCPACRKLRNEITPPIFEKYKNQVKVAYLDYIFSQNYEKLVALEEKWKIEDKTSVEIFSNAGFVTSEDEGAINTKIEKLIQDTLSLSESDKKKVTGDVAGNLENIIFKRFKGFTLWVVAGAGLLDGLNPCAFATIIFMVNLLMVLGHSRRRIFEIGITYSLSVFCTYLLLGLGLFRIWQSLSVYQVFSRIIYGVMASLLLIFAVLSIKDAIQYRKDKKETEFSLGLPKGFRVKINQYLKKSFSEKKLLVAAILSGFVISLLEAGCTGQIYLPTIMYIARQTTSFRAIFFLILYNIFFIIPLFIVFLGVYYGSQSKTITSFGRKNILFSKLALGGLFIVLSLLLWQSALS